MFNSIKNLFTPPVFEDEDKTRIAFYFNAITLSSFGLLMILLIIRIVQMPEEIFNSVNNILFALLSLLLTTWYLMKLGYVRFASHTIVGLAWAGMAYLAWEADGIRDSTFIAFIAIIIMSSLLLGTRTMIIYTAASLLAGLGLANLEASGAIQPRLDTPGNYARDLAFIFALIGIFLYLLTSSLNNAVAQARTAAREFQASNTELKILQGDLEKRVEKRTTELDAANRQAQRRAAQLEAIAQVVRNISTSQNLETLLPKITNVVSEQFGFYHIGIFLLEEESEYAVLRAANSPGGKKMLVRGHQLKVGETGIVGFVTGQGRPRIVLDTGSDVAYYDNPDLPDTRSEMALPLIVGNRVIGALDVQSVEPNAFSNEDVSTLSTLAEQISIAIQNANLYEETQQALANSQALYHQFTKSGWSQLKQTHNLVGIHRSNANSTILNEPLALDAFNGQNTLEIPINLRGLRVGSLKIRTSNERKWTQDDIDIASAIIERAAINMENARLLNDAQRRATREQIIGNISATLSSSTDMEEILRSTVQELGRSLGGAEVLLELKTKESELQE